MTDIHQIPLDRIGADALIRDRSVTDAEADSELAASILAQGLRQPIELWELPDDEGEGPRYGLISGFRRLAACRLLEHATIPAFIRSPATGLDLYTLMVAENEMRAQITPWEKGALAFTLLRSGRFPNADTVIDHLFSSLGRQKKHRLRSILMVVEEFDGCFSTPERLSTQRIERLAAALRAGWAGVIHDALPHPGAASLETQWHAIEPVLAEALAPADSTFLPPGDPAAPRRLRGLTLRRELTRTGWIIRFSGPDARSPGLIDDVFEVVEQWLGER